jgi:hypothetical protein
MALLQTAAHTSAFIHGQGNVMNAIGAPVRALLALKYFRDEHCAPEFRNKS